MEELRNKYKILVGKLKARDSLCTPRRNWEDNIKMHFTEIWRRSGWAEWINLISIVTA